MQLDYMGHLVGFLWAIELDLYRAFCWIVWGIQLDYMEHAAGLYRACSWIIWGILLDLYGAFSWIQLGYPHFPPGWAWLFWGGIWDASSTTDGMLLAAHHPCSRNAVVPRAIPILIPVLPAGWGWSQHPWVGARCPPGATHPFPAPCTPPRAGWRCQTPAQASVGLTLSEAQEP